MISLISRIYMRKRRLILGLRKSYALDDTNFCFDVEIDKSKLDKIKLQEIEEEPDNQRDDLDKLLMNKDSIYTSLQYADSLDALMSALDELNSPIPRPIYLLVVKMLIRLYRKMEHFSQKRQMSSNSKLILLLNDMTIELCTNGSDIELVNIVYLMSVISDADSMMFYKKLNWSKYRDETLIKLARRITGNAYDIQSLIILIKAFESLGCFKNLEQTFEQLRKEITARHKAKNYNIEHFSIARIFEVISNCIIADFSIADDILSVMMEQDGFCSKISLSMKIKVLRDLLKTHNIMKNKKSLYVGSLLAFINNQTDTVYTDSMLTDCAMILSSGFYEKSTSISAFARMTIKNINEFFGKQNSLTYSPLLMEIIMLFIKSEIYGPEFLGWRFKQSELEKILEKPIADGQDFKFVTFTNRLCKNLLPLSGHPIICKLQNMIFISSLNHARSGIITPCLQFLSKDLLMRVISECDISKINSRSFINIQILQKLQGISDESFLKRVKESHSFQILPEEELRLYRNYKLSKDFVLNSKYSENDIKALSTENFLSVLDEVDESPECASLRFFINNALKTEEKFTIFWQAADMVITEKKFAPLCNIFFKDHRVLRDSTSSMILKILKENLSFEVLIKDHFFEIVYFLYTQLNKITQKRIHLAYAEGFKIYSSFFISEFVFPRYFELCPIPVFKKFFTYYEQANQKLLPSITSILIEEFIIPPETIVSFKSLRTYSYKQIALLVWFYPKLLKDIKHKMRSQEIKNQVDSNVLRGKYPAYMFDIFISLTTNGEEILKAAGRIEPKSLGPSKLSFDILKALIYHDHINKNATSLISHKLLDLFKFENAGMTELIRLAYFLLFTADLRLTETSTFLFVTKMFKKKSFAITQSEFHLHNILISFIIQYNLQVKFSIDRQSLFSAPDLNLAFYLSLAINSNSFSTDGIRFIIQAALKRPYLSLESAYKLLVLISQGEESQKLESITRALEIPIKGEMYCRSELVDAVTVWMKNKFPDIWETCKLRSISLKTITFTSGLKSCKNGLKLHLNKLDFEIKEIFISGSSEKYIATEDETNIIVDDFGCLSNSDPFTKLLECNILLCSPEKKVIKVNIPHLYELDVDQQYQYLVSLGLKRKILIEPINHKYAEKVRGTQINRNHFLLSPYSEEEMYLDHRKNSIYNIN
jgi:hypothetical protein